MKVILDGQGGDEILAGYHDFYKYYFADLLKGMKLIKLLKEIYLHYKYHKYPVIRSIADAIKLNLGDKFKSAIKKALGIRKRKHAWLKTGKEEELEAARQDYKFKEMLNNKLYDALFTVLPPLLRYEDRNSMAHSVESRLPFLDLRLVEFVFGFPGGIKIKDGFTKALLRNSLAGILPEEVRLRKDKIGFATPEKIWFKTILKEQIREIIYSKSFQGRKYIDGVSACREFEDYCKGKKEITDIIWRWVNLELWFRNCLEK